MAASRCWVGGELPGKHDADEYGAHEWNRTIDLLLTKEVLYRLSYVSGNFFLLPWNDSLVEQAAQWSGRRESNPRNQFGKLRFYH
jgi:hypothetical protein